MQQINKLLMETHCMTNESSRTSSIVFNFHFNNSVAEGEGGGMNASNAAKFN